MPKLSQLSCSIELGTTNIPLKEHRVKYADGAVECCIAAIDQDIPFSIHLTADKYDAAGLAVFVFADGVYQCNRNISNGAWFDQDPRSTKHHDIAGSQIDVRLRQKEEKLRDGQFIGREWTFSKLEKTKSSRSENKNLEQNVGTIEVIVRRCHYGLDKPVDGRFGLDGAHDSDNFAERIDEQHLCLATDYQKPVAEECEPDPDASHVEPVLADRIYDGCYYFVRHPPVDEKEVSTRHIVNTDGSNDRMPGVTRVERAVEDMAEQKSYLRGAGVEVQYLLPLLKQDESLLDLDWNDLSRDDVRYLREATKRLKRMAYDKSRSATLPSSISDTNNDQSDSNSYRDNEHNTAEDEFKSSADTRSSSSSSGSSGSGNTSTQAVANDQNDLQSQAQAAVASNDGANDDQWQNNQNSGGWDNSNEKKSHGSKKSSKSHTRHSGWSSSSNSFSSSSASSSASSTTVGPKIKPYWETWNQTTTVDTAEGQSPHARPVYVLPPLATPAVPAKARTHADRGVQAGEGAYYTHERMVPTYIDSMSAPYAVFTFRYYSVERLEKILGRSLKDEMEQTLRQATRDQLMNRSKNSIVEELIRLRAGCSREPKKTSTADSSSRWSSSGSSSSFSSGKNMVYSPKRSHHHRSTKEKHDQGGSTKTKSNKTKSNKSKANEGFTPDTGADNKSNGFQW